MIKLNLLGQIYGRWTVVEAAGTNNKRTLWKCRCECGNTRVLAAWYLTGGVSKSCGCYQTEVNKNRFLTHGNSVGNKLTPEYGAWAHIKTRCYNKNVHNYKNYGGRGIRVCDRWLLSFENFLKDMGVRPSDKHSLDRFPNFNGDYEPNNCRWATIHEQNRCKRSNRWFEHNGVKMVMTDWAKVFNVTISSLSEMVDKKPFNEVVNFYKNKNKKIYAKDNSIRK